jgi:hypothetical protein
MSKINNFLNNLSQPNKKVYLSAWDNTITYSVNDFTAYGGKIYKAILGTNLNKIPSSEPTYWGEFTLGTTQAEILTELQKAAIIAASNTDYATSQVRNVIISTSDANNSLGSNGDIWIKYIV